MPWVPKPNTHSQRSESIPRCWVECDGRLITEGIWAGQRTPDLNNAGRFLRGGTQANVLETQEDALQDHTHYISDPGHSHSFSEEGSVLNINRRIKSGDDIWWYIQDLNLFDTDLSKTGININGIKSGRQSDETRPKNMKVIFIMKICMVSLCIDICWGVH